MYQQTLPWSLKIERIALLGIIMISFLEARPQWNSDPLVNTPVCTTVETQQFYPQVVPDQSGGVIAIWQEFTADMDSALIYAQHLNINGLKLWAGPGIKISGSDAISTTPLAVSDGSGGVIVSWLKTENGAINHYIQRVSPTGNILWNPEGVAACPNSNVSGFYYQLISDGKGGAIILWDDNGGGPNPNRIQAQRIDAGGNLAWSDNGLQVTPQFAAQSSYDAVPDLTGGMVFTWYMITGSQTRNDIFIQHVSGDGQPLWGANGITVCGALSDQLYSKIIKDKHENYIVIWQDFRHDPDYSQFYGRRILSGGTLQWQPQGTLLADSVAAGSTIGKIVTDTMGGGILAWVDDFIPGSNNDHDNQLYSVHFDSTGNLTAAKKPVSHWLDQSAPVDFEIAADNKNGCYISWGNSQDLTQLLYDIYAQHVLPGGGREFPDTGKVVCQAPNLQYYQQLIYDTIAERPILVWTDLRSGISYDLYAGIIGENIVVPVHWLEFTGERRKDHVVLAWKTSDEFNNEGFVIQKRSNENDFDSIGFVKAQNSPGIHSYSFDDGNPLPGISHYRLKQVDIDHQFKYSKTVRIISQTPNALQIYPNPARSILTVTGVRRNTIILVYDLQGRVVKTVQVPKEEIVNIDVSGLGKGIYYLNIKNDGPSATKAIRFIKD
ncbi:MAG TPA: T9SS type A sorting domain-containing protein [Chryseolinea sp.]|nr:T9SS type A sorting domain-containing protein [Chryseolinea sp.]